MKNVMMGRRSLLLSVVTVVRRLAVWKVAEIQFSTRVKSVMMVAQYREMAVRQPAPMNSAVTGTRNHYSVKIVMTAIRLIWTDVIRLVNLKSLRCAVTVSVHFLKPASVVPWIVVLAAGMEHAIPELEKIVPAV